VLKLKEVMSEGWWDNLSDAAKKAYIKKHGSAPNVAGDDDEKEPSADPGSTWDKHSTKVKATSPEHQKEIDTWMKKYSNPKGGVDWDKAKKDNAPFPKGEPDDPSRSRGRDDVPKEPLARGTKVTASWKGLSGEEQEIPDGQIEDVKYSDSGHEVSYVIRWNNGNNLIELPADKVKGVGDIAGEPDSADGDIKPIDNDKGVKRMAASIEKKTNSEPGSLELQGRTNADDGTLIIQWKDKTDGMLMGISDDGSVYEDGKKTSYKADSGSGRTGNELNQETLTIDGKQYRRISEVEQESKHEFAEFYQRFKR
jgi:hypothetical protein